MIGKKLYAVGVLLLLSGCHRAGAPVPQPAAVQKPATVQKTATLRKTAAAPDGKCDRECLAGFITQYMKAMIEHKPESLPVASTVKFTEDCKELKLGEGEWKIITGLTDYRRDVLDVKQGVAVSFIIVEEGDRKALFPMRLKIVDKKITEIETQAVHSQQEAMLLNLANLKTVSKTMAFVPEKSQLPAREDAIKAAMTYADGLKIGSFVKVDSPMAPDAYRYENGQLMAGPGCTFFQGCQNMKTQTIPRLAGITQRVIAADEEMGVVAVRMNFGPGSVMGSGGGGGELDVWHSFKIYDGQIRAAEAFFKVAPAGTKSGWE
jgi:hypothetical protein